MKKASGISRHKLKRLHKLKGVPRISRKSLALVSSLIVLLALTGVLAQWTSLHRPAPVSKTVAAVPTAGQASKITSAAFDASSPSKEYVYAGGRMVATEEPGGGGSGGGGGGGCSGQANPRADFDQDHKSEMIYYHNGVFGILKSSIQYSYSSGLFFGWGAAGSLPLVADFDGDGKADPAYIAPSGSGQIYAILLSSTGYNVGQGLFLSAGFPGLGDIPIAADFDGDHKADPGLWRSSTGQWIIPTSSSNYTTNIFAQWGGQAGDIPIAADFDCDGKADIGYYRSGLWAILTSSSNYISAQFYSWGGAGLQPIAADFDGDGKADLAYIVPPAGGQSQAYAILKSSTGYNVSQPLFVPAGWPSLGDTPVVGDFDGDGKADPGIWRSSDGTWIIPLSSGAYTTYLFSSWGVSGDTVLPNRLTQY